MLWALTCLLQLRLTTGRLHQTVLVPRTVSSMNVALNYKGTEEDPHMQEVKGLTCAVKGVLVAIVFLPQILITLFLLWLGSRWLVATADLADLLLNAVALEFV